MFLREKWIECAGKIIVSDRRPKLRGFVRFIKERAMSAYNEFGYMTTGPRSDRQNENKRGQGFMNKQALCLDRSERHEIWKCERFKGFIHTEKR